MEADGGGVPFWWRRKPYYRSAHAILTDAEVMQATSLLRSPLERFSEVLYVCDIGVMQRAARLFAVTIGVPYQKPTVSFLGTPAAKYPISSLSRYMKGNDEKINAYTIPKDLCFLSFYAVYTSARHVTWIFSLNCYII